MNQELLSSLYNQETLLDFDRKEILVETNCKEVSVKVDFSIKEYSLKILINGCFCAVDGTTHFNLGRDKLWISQMDYQDGKFTLNTEGLFRKGDLITVDYAIAGSKLQIKPKEKVLEKGYVKCRYCQTHTLIGENCRNCGASN